MLEILGTNCLIQSYMERKSPSVLRTWPEHKGQGKPSCLSLSSPWNQSSCWVGLQLWRSSRQTLPKDVLMASSLEGEGSYMSHENIPKTFRFQLLKSIHWTHWCQWPKNQTSNINVYFSGNGFIREELPCNIRQALTFQCHHSGCQLVPGWPCP